MSATLKFDNVQLKACSGSSAWVDITGKPSTFPPSAHTHPATDVTEDTTHRFATDAEKTTWNAKETTAGSQAKADAAQSAAIAAAAADATSKANAAQAAAIAACSATVSTADPSGTPADGALWIKYTA